MSDFDRRFLLGGLAGAAGVSALGAIARAGPLDPPAGAVTGTSKPLGEIEPRIAINTTNTPGTTSTVFRITQPGSYYLTGNVTVPANRAAIQVAAGNVTIDLNGCTIGGSGSTSNGIVNAPGSSAGNLTILNGTIRDVGTGIDAGNINAVRIERTSIIGYYLNGIVTGENALISRCFVSWINSGNGIDSINVGIHSVVTDCVVRDVYRYGIMHNGYGLITNCHIYGGTTNSPTNQMGIYAYQRTIVRACQVSVCQIGIKARNWSRVESCHVNHCSWFGIAADEGASIKIIDNDIANCGDASGDAGILVQANLCSVEGNRLEANYRHIWVGGGTGNLIVSNTMASAGAGGNLVVPAGNSYGPIVTLPSGDIGGTANANHPQANLVHG